jgi:hypothetical protein
MASCDGSASLDMLCNKIVFASIPQFGCDRDHHGVHYRLCVLRRLQGWLVLGDTHVLYAQAGFDKSFAEGLHGFVLFKSTFPIYGAHFSSILLRAFALRLSKCNGLLQ